MKNPYEWQSYFAENLMHQTSYPVPTAEFIEMVQRDALSDPLANISDQRELEMAQMIADNERIRADQLHEQMMKWREKYHEARRYLRAANKGAERNNMVMRLQSETIKKLLKQ